MEVRLKHADAVRFDDIEPGGEFIWSVSANEELCIKRRNKDNNRYMAVQLSGTSKGQFVYPSDGSMVKPVNGYFQET